MIAETEQKTGNEDSVRLEPVTIGGETFYRISDVADMPPFFMSIVSDSNHWMFISSNGGLSAGRKDADHALFPYYTDDKITAAAENTGSKSIFWVTANNEQQLWEPFSERGEGKFNCTRHLYKSKFGNKIIFEEINNSLGLCFQYQWNSSNLYGFVRNCKLTNLSGAAVQVKLLDGLQNILPCGVGSDLQNSASNLANAYKRSELIPETGLAIFALSAIIVDKAEPSEALKANVAWCLGLNHPQYLLSTLQLKNFRQNGRVRQEEDIKGEKGAFFAISELWLQAGEEKEWMMAANVNQGHAAIVQLSAGIKTDPHLAEKVRADVDLGTENLVKLAAASDGLQFTADELKDTRHFSNVLFNIMRGGIFDDNYRIEKWDFSRYLRRANAKLWEELEPQLAGWPEIFDVTRLHQLALASGNIHFRRLATEYLPLKFSRRHGDPSRPWNQFSINTRSETDGSKILDYQGNWRDIFQNWEALAHAWPGFIEGMIAKFLNASTFDGYNPYRVTRDGFDWETIEPDNPWSYIGYWGDHQIIYLLKFFELMEYHQPGKIQMWLGDNAYVYAHVPYKIKPYEEILRNPKDTIEFDQEGDRSVHGRMAALGADGALLTSAAGEIYYVSFCEKWLATVLAKLSNFVPGGGIWMNTQRPEWNDANNALVGNGLSMVTLCYLRRFLTFFLPIFEKDPGLEIPVSAEMYAFFEKIAAAFEQYKSHLSGSMNDRVRKEMTDALGRAGSDYRTGIYSNGFSGEKKTLSSGQILDCIHTVNAFLEQSITVNRRSDDLYHTYNLMAYDEQSVKVEHLNEMLEGQVAVLSSGFLSAGQALKLLNALKSSSLYRADQYSYLLYPNKNLPGFLQKNNIPKALAEKSKLMQEWLAERNLSVIEADINGGLHFNGNFRNAADLDAALQQMEDAGRPLPAGERELILQIFEEVFCHKAFLGRSGTFFGYEGLGSIYWHMVSKLLLAVQETCLHAIQEKADEELVHGLVKHYYEINEGIGVHKPPRLYGAFPTDPYSHTPMGRGAQQPGMTGQVKEDILCRFGELGVWVTEGILRFNPLILKRNQFNPEAGKVEYIDVNGARQELMLPANAIFFTYCQTPVLYELNGQEGIEVLMADGSARRDKTTQLTAAESRAVFERSGGVRMIRAFFKEGEWRG